MPALLAVLLIAVSGCYHPGYRDCDVSCASGVCPSGLECRASMCRVPGATGTCETFDAGIDGPDATFDAPLLPFGTPMRLEELVSNVMDQDPALTGDQLEMIFSSNRTGGVGMSDLWSATRLVPTDPFSNITNLGPGINTAQEELHPWISADGLVLYFVSGIDGTQSIYRSSRNQRGQPFSNPTLVPELDSTANEGSVGLSPDQLYLVLDSDKAAPPERDLYLAMRSSAGTTTFSGPTLITSLDVMGANRNTPCLIGTSVIYFVEVDAGVPRVLRSERSGLTATTPVELTELGHASDPWVSQDEKTIYFTSSMAGTLDIYMATRP